ncbi:GNAT family N-acetyltransferase [Mycobacterium simiae]|uniref:GNAT family N-acetyltransferase n=1 Tax=Mycobacterium simiae TaxID=1784 RepID=UPI000413DE0D|nr:GNAT family N-acetyltransferase [Mycobacterium simiae]PLV53183.1 acyltransferase [Mycobacterium tuberculosis variant microti OV254]BBX42980.1 N-acetyltransferase [Mycobacterium simiae]
MTRIRTMTQTDTAECARICYKAFNAIAARHNFPSDFPSATHAHELVTSLQSHPEFFSIVAESDDRLVGSNFLDERSAIFSVGPVSVASDVQDRGIGRLLMQAVLDRSSQRKAWGVRLVQLAYHNRSMSLYTKLGFKTREPLAAMQGEPVLQQFDGFEVRGAQLTDLAECDKLCLQVHGHDRSGEVRDAISQGSAKVVERDGRITGYTTDVGFTGHSVAVSNDDLIALIASADKFSWNGFLVPLRNAELLRWCFDQGLRIVYILNLMSLGHYQEPRGSFLASIGY